MSIGFIVAFSTFIYFYSCINLPPPPAPSPLIRLWHEYALRQSSYDGRINIVLGRYHSMQCRIYLN